jgi:hypothetical protein
MITHFPGFAQALQQKSDGLNLVLWTQTSTLSELIESSNI